MARTAVGEQMNLRKSRRMLNPCRRGKGNYISSHTIARHRESVYDLRSIHNHEEDAARGISDGRVDTSATSLVMYIFWGVGLSTSQIWAATQRRSALGLTLAPRKVQTAANSPQIWRVSNAALCARVSFR